MADLVARHPFSGSSNQTVALTKTAKALVLFNDGSTDVVVTINNYSFTIKNTDPPFDELVDPFINITIVASGSYHGYVRG